MTTIQEVLFTKQDGLIPYLYTQMNNEHTGQLPWELLDYITYDVNEPIVEEVKCALCGKHIETYVHYRYNDYSVYGELFCTPCYDDPMFF